jgi:hypothetical protein
MTTRIVWLVTLVLCFAAATPAAAQTSGTPHWRIYQNDRYGTTIDYPGLFKAEPPPDNNDGRQFKSADGAEFAVFASYNALDFDIAGYQQFTLKNLARARPSPIKLTATIGSSSPAPKATASSTNGICCRTARR